MSRISRSSPAHRLAGVQDGDLYGGHINFAARIAGQADGGEIVISELLRQLIEPSGAFILSEREAVTLTGLDGTFVLHNVQWQGDATRVSRPRSETADGSHVTDAPSTAPEAGETMQLTLTDEAIEQVRRKGGVMALDFIPPIA